MESGSKAPIVLIGTKIDLPLSDHQVNSAVGIYFIYLRVILIFGIIKLDGKKCCKKI